jgi:hypothetical protein
MAAEPRASERARAGVAAGPGRARLLLQASALTLALAACRQTVILDPSLDSSDGAANTGGAGAGDNGPRTDGGRPDVFSGGNFCVGGQIQPLSFTLRAPDVIFSVDRSAWMQSWFGNGTRLEVMQQQVHSLILKYGRIVRFGYQEFPSPTAICGSPQGCCAGDVTPPTVNSRSSIDRAIAACAGNGNTCVVGQRPLAHALSKCEDAYLAFSDSGHNRYVLLLTGGEPTCLGPDSTRSSCDNAEAQVLKMNNGSSISTAVFGVDNDLASGICLDRLAQAGGLDNGAEPFYHLVRTPTELSDALGPVVKRMAEEACHIDVRSPPADPDKVWLLFDNVPVPIDGVNGWQFDPGVPLKITVRGTWCDTLLQQQTPHVDLVSVSGCMPPHH